MNKTLICIDYFGNVQVIPSESPEITHDELAYNFYKEFLDKLTEEEIKKVADISGIKDFYDFPLKNIMLIVYYLNTLIVTENTEWLAFILPFKISNYQYTYIMENYEKSNIYFSCYYFNKNKNFALDEINDFLHPVRSKIQILNLVKEIYEETMENAYNRK